MMKKIFSIIGLLFMLTVNAFANTDSLHVEQLDSVSVVSFYRNNVNVGSLVNHKAIVAENHGQEPSHLFKNMPGIFSMSDNGTEFGYGYFRIRGLDQTRINVTLDGMPWNEAEDYGTYFANSPDLLSSMHTVKVERGSSATNNGTASSGGSINLESIDLLKDTESYGYIGGGSFGTYKTSVVYNSGLFGKSAVHVKATQQQTEGFRDYGFNNSQAFTIKYGYFFNSKHSIDILSLNGRHRNGQGWLGCSLDELSVNPRANGNIKTEDDEWFQTVNKIQYKGWLNDKTLLTSSAYLQYQTGWYNMDLDNYMWRMVDETWANTGIRYSYGLEHYLYGGNIAGKFYLGNLTLTTGTNIYAYQREHYMDERLAEHYANVPKAEFYDNIGSKRDANVFVSAQYRAGKFLLGTNVQYRYVDFSYNDKIDAANSFDANKHGTKWNFINYGANIDYNFNNASKIYVRFAVVSREPTRTDMFGGNEFFPGDITTNQNERSYDVEAGYVMSNDWLELNINAYYMKFQNERVLNGNYGLNGLPLHDTASNSFRTGIELSGDVKIYNGLHYKANVSGSENRINSETFVNKYHILTPAVTLSHDVYYKGNNFTAGVNHYYHSKMYMDQENQHEIPYYMTLNLYGTYKYKNLEFGLRVNNITNRVNYYNAALGSFDKLYFREAGTNFFADVKIYF